MFWHIPKTGGNSLNSALQKFIDITPDYYYSELADIRAYEQYRHHQLLQGRTVRDHGFKEHFGFTQRPPVLVNYEDVVTAPLRDLYHINIEAGSQILMLIKNNRQSRLWNVDVKQFYEFTIVREPLDRLISVYNYMPYTIGHLSTFEQFAKIVAFYYKHPEQISDFYDSQLEWATRSYTNKINVFKLEKHTKWFPELCDALNLGNPVFPKENVMSTPHMTRDMLSDDVKKFCYKFLEQEYDLLGY